MNLAQGCPSCINENSGIEMRWCLVPRFQESSAEPQIPRLPSVENEDDTKVMTKGGLHPWLAGLGRAHRRSLGCARDDKGEGVGFRERGYGTEIFSSSQVGRRPIPPLGMTRKEQRFNRVWLLNCGVFKSNLDKSEGQSSPFDRLTAGSPD
jgi:hypothetical protein